VTTVNLGAGDDQLLNGGSNGSNLTFTGATFNGGEGTDTVAISLITVGNAAKFTSFETLGLDIASAGTSDTSILGGITGLSLLENSSGTVNYTASLSQGLTLAKTTTNSGGTTAIDFGTAVTGSADAYTLTFAGTGTTSATATPTVVNPGIVKITGIEAVTLASGGSGYTNNTIVLNDANARTLTITGSQKATVSFDATTNAFGTASTSSTSSTGVSLIDASALTGKLALTISGAYLGTAYAGIAVKGGSNDDTIILAAQTGTGRYTVDAGAGVDAITTSTTAATLTGGAGNDSFDVTLTTSGVSDATGLDSALVYTTITDFAAGDTIKMGTTSVTYAGKTFVSAATSLTSSSMRRSKSV
jgi:S-layer protein